MLSLNLMKKVLMLLPLAAMLAVGQTTNGPSVEEKLALTKAVKNYYKAHTELAEATEQLTKKVNDSAAVANKLKSEMQTKFNCTYNLDTDECVPNPKVEVSK